MLLEIQVACEDPALLPLSKHISRLLWKLLLVYLHGIFQAARVCLGYWMSHHGASMSSAGKEVLLSLAQQPELCSALTTLRSLAASALGSWESQQAGLAAAQGTCNAGSALQTKWYSHHVRLGHWEKQEKKGLLKGWKKRLSVCDTAVKRHRRWKHGFTGWVMVYWSVRKS